MKNITIIISLFFSFFVQSQSQFTLHFTPKVQSSELSMNELVSVNGIKVNFDHFNYYLSNLHIIYDGNQDLDLSDTVFLVKSNDFRLNLGLLNISNVEKIQFGIGVPEHLNHLDISKYKENHPLSFQTPSMHWGWAAGYMHMIIGGYADSNGDENTDAYFELHNLGDLNYYQTEVVVNEFNTSENQKDIYIDCNIDTWLTSIDIATIGIKHSENGVNKNVLKNITLYPVFTSSLNASTPIISGFSGEVFFQKIENNLKLTWKGINHATKIKLISMDGKIISQNNEIENQGTQNFQNLKSGIYLANFYSNQNQLLNQIKIIY
jgi:hypothetical protein